MKKNFIDESGRYTTSYLEPNLYDEGVSTIQREYAPVYDEVPSYQPLPFFGEAIDNPYNPKLYVPQEPEMPVYEQPVYGQPVYQQPIYEQPVMPEPDMPIYNPKFYNPIDEIMNPPALPIYDLPPAPIEPEQPVYTEPQPKLSLYIPKFPDFNQMSCADLQAEINDMNQIMMTSRMVQEVRMAYETALSDAQNAYIQKCGKKEEPTPAPINVNPPATTGGGTSPVFSDDTKTPVKVVQSGDKADGTFPDDTKAKLPTKMVSKNLQPYIYAGLGIVVILLVSRMLTKKN